MSSPEVLLLMGATATGKTELALEISRQFPVEIISVDSALVYQGMDIGTAKPGREVLDSAPHHLVDIIDPVETFSVWDFVQQSRRLVREISKRGRIPLLAGGTMMYYHAFEHGLNRLPQAKSAVIHISLRASRTLRLLYLDGFPGLRLSLLKS